MQKIVFALLALIQLILAPMQAHAHGERAQQPALRMRTVHWFDVDISARKLDVGQTLVIKGSFMPSMAWPRHIASIEETAFLNIGVPGPSFIRLDSRVNGVPGIRSTSFEKGERYDFEVTLRARTPGRYHVHPMINVKDTGPIIGPGLWVEVGGTQEGFSNTVKTLTGQTIDLESYGLSNVAFWSALWGAVGLAWFVYWLTKVPLVMPRFVRVAQLGENADQMITTVDRRIALVFLVLTASLIVVGFLYGNEKWPITTPLQTGHIDIPPRELPPPQVKVEMGEARYRIPGRSFRVELTVHNGSDGEIQLGEFAAGSLRFTDSSVHKVVPGDPDELIATDALHVEGGPVAPGQTRKIVMYADDAMWETQRMTTLIASPDAVVAGMLFFYDGKGRRHMVEIAGPMIPMFGS